MKRGCYRCGMCCIAMPCVFSPENGSDDKDCSYLYVHGDLHTSCLCSAAQRQYIGTGCLFAGNKQLYNRLKGLNCVKERKKEIRNEQCARTRCVT